MNNSRLTYGFLLVLLPILQVSLFNNVNLMGYIDPYVYIIFVFVFPFNKDKTGLLVGSFILGLFIDLLTNDGGIHAFSLVFIAYIRFFLLRLLSGKSTFEIEESTIHTLRFPILFMWIVILTIIHHFLVFTLEQFSFTHFGHLIFKTVVSTLLSMVLIIFGLQLFMTKKSHA